MFCAAHFTSPVAENLAFCALPRLERGMAPKIQHRPHPPKTSYEELLVRIGAQKDRKAFVTLFEYYAPRVKSYLLKHGASETAAEEIVQNTFITVWEKAASYNPKKAAASTWIFTIARNKRIDALRKEKFIEVNTDDPALVNAAATAPETYADAEDTAQLNAALEYLPEEQAKLLHMAFFEDKSHSAIAKETRLPLGTVKSRLRLALEKLRYILKAEVTR